MIIQANSARRWPLADKSVQCIVTSPPYFRHRDYGMPGQIGQESTVGDFVCKLQSAFREAWRVLRADGTLWVVIADSYSDGGSGAIPGFRRKELVDVSGLLLEGLRSLGWLLRKRIIWHKNNAMPDSATDRCTSSHEYILHFSKSRHYFYDHEAIKEFSPLALASPDLNKSTLLGGGHGRHVLGEAIPEHARRVDKQRGHSRRHAGFNERWDGMTHAEQAANGRNKRDVWTVPTCGAMDDGGVSHFAAFPPKLIEPCILAGAPMGGIVLDPFAGTGTTVYTSQRLGRIGIGLELRAEWARTAARNCGLPVHRQGILL